MFTHEANPWSLFNASMMSCSAMLRRYGSIAFESAAVAVLGTAPGVMATRCSPIFVSQGIPNNTNFLLLTDSILEVV